MSYKQMPCLPRARRHPSASRGPLNTSLNPFPIQPNPTQSNPFHSIPTQPSRIQPNPLAPTRCGTTCRRPSRQRGWPRQVMPSSPLPVPSASDWRRCRIDALRLSSRYTAAGRKGTLGGSGWRTLLCCLSLVYAGCAVQAQEGLSRTFFLSSSPRCISGRG